MIVFNLIFFLPSCSESKLMFTSRSWLFQMKFLYLIFQAQSEKWDELEAVANAKGREMGWAALVDLCMDHGNPQESIKYVMKLDDFQYKINTLIGLQAWKEAAFVAEQDNNTEVLQFLHKKCNDHQLKQRIEALLSR